MKQLSKTVIRLKPVVTGIVLLLLYSCFRGDVAMVICQDADRQIKVEYSVNHKYCLATHMDLGCIDEINASQDDLCGDCINIPIKDHYLPTQQVQLVLNQAISMGFTSRSDPIQGMEWASHVTGQFNGSSTLKLIYTTVLLI